MVKKPNGIMSEFFLELFSEEIPVNLQKNAREALLKNFKDFFEKENISFFWQKLYLFQHQIDF